MLGCVDGIKKHNIKTKERQQLLWLTISDTLCFLKLLLMKSTLKE